MTRGAVEEIYGAESIGVEFVAASGRTQALVTLRPDDLRPVADDDLVAVRPEGLHIGAMANKALEPSALPPSRALRLKRGVSRD